MHTIARMYDSYSDASQVVNALEAAGIPHSDISLIANTDAQGRSAATTSTAETPLSASHLTGGGTSPVDPARTDDTNAEAGAKRGATAGTVLGGAAGLLAGIGALAIPGIGPVVAAGWLVAALTGAGVGAAAGGLVGSLTGAGVSNDEAHVYSEGVKRGGTLVTVRTQDADAGRIEALMAERNPVDWQQRRAAYGSDWSQFDGGSTPKAATTTGTTPGTGPVIG
jgi:hypothetical protein